MTSAVQTDTSYDLTDAARIVKYAMLLGAIQSVVVVVVATVNWFLEGTADHALTGVVVALGITASVFLPGLWTRARTIEGIGGAAGIGLGAALTFLVIDLAVLQPVGLWTNRWLAVGGHSNWWYHPVWWMVSCYLGWMGAFILAQQTARRGEPSVPRAIILVAVLAGCFGALAVVIKVPLASWNVPTFAVAVLPALALATVLSGIGKQRS